jgi:hypothetical protein
VAVGVSPYYGEGLYLGSGTYPNYGPVTNVLVDGGEIYNTRAEGIDVKANIQDAIIRGVYVHDCILPYNGAITVGAEYETGFDSTYLIQNCTTRNITTSGGAYNVFAHLAIGRGDITVEDCLFDGTASHNYEYGINMMTIAKNTLCNDALIARNFFGDILSERRLAINLYDNSTGQTDEIDFFVVPTIDKAPVFWIDASDATTVTEASNACSAITDKSGMSYTLSQSNVLFRPITNSRTIGGRKAIEFANNEYMTITNGPQLPASSMIFIVLDSDITAFNRTILSFQVGTTTRISLGVSSSGFFFGHGDSGYTVISTPASTGGILLSAYRDGVTQYLTDGTAVVTNSTGEDQRLLSKWIIGASEFGSGISREFDGAIGEIRVFDFYDAAKFASETASLVTKWGL